MRIGISADRKQVAGVPTGAAPQAMQGALAPRTMGLHFPRLSDPCKTMHGQNSPTPACREMQSAPPTNTEQSRTERVGSKKRGDRETR